MPQGRGKGNSAGGGGRGRRGGGFNAGSGGNCVCPQCNTKVPHVQGTPCSSVQCPACGSPMTREL